MALRDRRLDTDNPTERHYYRKANEQWELAGCARVDGDKTAEADHTARAREYERLAREAAGQ